MTAPKWPLVPLGDVVSHRKEFITIDDLTRYKRCRVQLHAKGVVLRDEVEGALIKTKSQQVCKANEFLVAEIDAKVGGFGMVPADLDGAIVSSHYFLFAPHPDKLLPAYLGYFSRTAAFREQVTSRGSTNYAAIRPGHVLGYTIPLPPLEEQRRIIARIDYFSGQIDKAARLQHQVTQGVDELCRSLLRDSHTTDVPMQDLVRLREPDVTVLPDESYQFAGVYCFGRGVFVGQHKTGMEFQYRKLTRLHTGDFVYPKLMAWEGALATVPPECNGLVVSTEFPVFEVNKARVLPEVLDVFFRTPQVWPRLSGASTGTNVRRRRLNPSEFLRFPFPLPPMDAQIRLRHTKAKADALRQSRASSTRGLAAFLPSLLDQAFMGAL